VLRAEQVRGGKPVRAEHGPQHTGPWAALQQQQQLVAVAHCCSSYKPPLEIKTKLAERTRQELPLSRHV